MGAHEISNEAERWRYELRLDGELAVVADYLVPAARRAEFGLPSGA